MNVSVTCALYKAVDEVASFGITSQSLLPLVDILNQCLLSFIKN